MGKATWPALRRASMEGRSETAAALAVALRDGLPRGYCRFPVLNELIDVLITAGAYGEARHTLERVPPRAQRVARRDDPVHHALVHINLAEADYCTGDLEAAASRMGVVRDAASRAPLTREGWRCQQSWILSLLGEGEEALKLARKIDLAGLPESYWAEAYFTRALANLTLGRVDAAERHAVMGLSLSRRPSSERNGQFLLGRVARAQGDGDQARGYMEVGIRHRYQAQGGAALLEHADFLQESGFAQRARTVYALVAERDPESQSAEMALRRVGASGYP